MKPSAIGRASARLAGWLFAAGFFAWLIFLLVPGPKAPVKTVPAAETTRQSSLGAVGLPDNPDLEGLPEYFAVWADRADWVNDRALFAYWSPATLDYSYFFEAIRKDGKIRFRAIRPPPEYTASRDADAPKPDEHPILLIHSNHAPAPVASRQGDDLGPPDPAAADEYKVPSRAPVVNVQSEQVKIEVKGPELPKK